MSVISPVGNGLKSPIGPFAKNRPKVSSDYAIDFTESLLWFIFDATL
jgi:hypothetical protein